MVTVGACYEIKHPRAISNPYKKRRNRAMEGTTSRFLDCESRMLLQGLTYRVFFQSQVIFGCINISTDRKRSEFIEGSPI
jgi:hypothetical protein